MDSIRAIKEFESLISYKKEGTIINLFVSATTSLGTLYQDYTDCRLFYEAGYMQYVVEIDWNVNNYSMHSLGLHSRYTTNFQTMSFENGSLVISDENVMISIEEK